MQAYDPTKVAGKALSAEWRAVFEETRKRYVEETAEIGIAQKGFRLRMLEKMFQKAMAMQNIGKAAELLEQAAKEVGGAFTNRRELSGPDGKPVQTESVAPADPKKQVLDELAAIFGDAANAGAAGEVNAATADAGAAAAEPPAGDRVLSDSAGGSSAAEPGASAASAPLDDEE